VNLMDPCRASQEMAECTFKPTLPPAPAKSKRPEIKHYDKEVSAAHHAGSVKDFRTRYKYPLERGYFPINPPRFCLAYRDRLTLRRFSRLLAPCPQVERLQKGWDHHEEQRAYLERLALRNYPPPPTDLCRAVTVAAPFQLSPPRPSEAARRRREKEAREAREKAEEVRDESRKVADTRMCLWHTMPRSSGRLAHADPRMFCAGVQTEAAGSGRR
jgi:hypothetical protein